MAKRARRDGVTDRQVEACETCDYFGCVCGTRCGPRSSTLDDRRELVDHLCRLSADMVSVTRGLQLKLLQKRCCVCGVHHPGIRRGESCACPQAGVATNHTVAAELRRLTGQLEQTLDEGRATLCSGFDKHLPNDYGVSDGGSDSVSDMESSSGDEVSSSEDEARADGS